MHRHSYAPAAGLVQSASHTLSHPAAVHHTERPLRVHYAPTRYVSTTRHARPHSLSIVRVAHVGHRRRAVPLHTLPHSWRHRWYPPPQPAVESTAVVVWGTTSGHHD